MRRLLLVALLSSAVVLGLGGTALAEGDMCDGGDCWAPTQCSDGLDNDSNGLVDLADPGCEGNPGDQSECCWVPPPEPPPPPPEPPPPPPPPQCSDGVDNDGDGTWDAAEPYGDWSCFSWDDNDESDYPAAAEFDLLGEEWTCGVTAQIPTTAQGEMCDTMNLVRCKRQNFRQTYKQTWWSGGYNILRYEGFYRVCYQHGQGIVTVLARTGDATWQVGYPYQWKGNETGYPQHYRFQHYVEFRFRGKLDFCPTWKVICSPRYPWLTIWFYDTNVQTRDAGIV
jgi:hypothetical protein